MKSGKNFFNNEQGAVALIVGITLVLVLIAILSLTIDLNRTQDSKIKNQGATDSAAAAGAELWLKLITDDINPANANPFATPAPDNLKTYAENILIENYNKDQSSGIYDPSSLQVSSNRYGPDPNGNYVYTVNVAACANLSTKIAAAAGHTAHNTNCASSVTGTTAGACTRTCTASTAQFGLTVLQNVEVAFALDFTNSMYWQGDATPNCPSDSRCITYADSKAAHLVQAMNDTLDNDAFFPKSNSTVWASIVPFSSIVNIYPYSKDFISDSTGMQGTATDVKGKGYYQGGSQHPYRTQTTQSTDSTGPSYHSFNSQYFFTDYGMEEDDPSYSYYNDVLDRIPSLTPSSLNGIISDSKDYSGTKFSSYRTVYKNLLTDLNSSYPYPLSHQLARNYCYNSALVAAFDQRIERETSSAALPNQNNKGLVKFYHGNTPPAEPALADANGNPTACADLDCYNLAANGSDKKYALYESYPIQPLTNNVQILKDVVNRFIATNSLYSDNYAPTGQANPPTPANTVDRQSTPLSRSQGWSYTLGTSGIHGMLWSWLTINDNWKDKWNAESVHEKYYSSDSAGSAASRSGLPNNKHAKHIIFMTDGHDNDDTGYFCDGYAPMGKLSTADYVRMCQKIKSENNGTTIHVLLLDFSDPASQARFDPAQGGCASEGEFYDGLNHTGVKPGEIEGIMTKIFKSIITNLATVKLVH